MIRVRREGGSLDRPLLSKEYCRELAPSPYSFVGYWDSLYHFTKGGNREGFITIAASKDDIKSGSLALMAKKGITR